MILIVKMHHPIEPMPYLSLEPIAEDVEINIMAYPVPIEPEVSIPPNRFQRLVFWVYMFGFVCFISAFLLCILKVYDII